MYGDIKRNLLSEENKETEEEKNKEIIKWRTIHTKNYVG